MRVLAYTSPARGHLYPAVPIVSELAARGHDVSVGTLSSELGHLAQAGIEGWAIDPAIEQIQIEDWRERSAAEGRHVGPEDVHAARAWRGP